MVGTVRFVQQATARQARQRAAGRPAAGGAGEEQRTLHRRHAARAQIENELPQPQVPLAVGFLKVKPRFMSVSLKSITEPFM